MSDGTSNTPNSITTTPVTPHLGAVVEGVDLSKPLSDAVFAQILDAFYEYHVLAFRQQDLSPDHHIAFASRFGELDVHPQNDALPDQPENCLPEHPEIWVLSNVGTDGELLPIDEGPVAWHSDLSYTKRAARANLLYCREIPPAGGETELANMHAAYDALPEEKQRGLEGMSAVHDRNWRYARRYPDQRPLTAEEIGKTPAATHPVVRTHPVTGRKSLFIYDNAVSHIVGMSEEDSRPVIQDIEEFATQPEFVYSHSWQEGDLVVLDECCTMHRRRMWDPGFRRVLHRVLVLGDPPVFSPAASG